MFSHNSLKPSLRLHRCKRPSKLSTQCESTVTLLAGNFLCNQKQPSAGEGKVANFPEFLEKNTIFNEHPVSGVMRRGMRGSNDIKGTVCQFTILAHVLLAEMMGLTDIQTIPLRHWSHC